MFPDPLIDAKFNSKNDLLNTIFDIFSRFGRIVKGKLAKEISILWILYVVIKNMSSFYMSSLK